MSTIFFSYEICHIAGKHRLTSTSNWKLAALIALVGKERWLRNIICSVKSSYTETRVLFNLISWSYSVKALSRWFAGTQGAALKNILMQKLALLETLFRHKSHLFREQMKPVIGPEDTSSSIINTLQKQRQQEEQKRMAKNERIAGAISHECSFACFILFSLFRFIRLSFKGWIFDRVKAIETSEKSNLF